jgi:hypothetical protein
MCGAWNAEKVCMETSKQVASMVLETIKSAPLLCGIAFFVLAILPGIVKLASMLPHAN